jgi:hypothetical protein
MPSPSHGQTSPWPAQSSSDQPMARQVHDRPSPWPAQPMGNLAHGHPRPWSNLTKASTVHVQTSHPSPDYAEHSPAHDKTMAGIANGKPRPRPPKASLEQRIASPAQPMTCTEPAKPLIRPASPWSGQATSSLAHIQPSHWPVKPIASPANDQPSPHPATPWPSQRFANPARAIRVRGKRSPWPNHGMPRTWPRQPSAWCGQSMAAKPAQPMNSPAHAQTTQC